MEPGLLTAIREHTHDRYAIFIRFRCAGETGKVV